MATTTFNTRIQLKYDTYTNWYNNNPTPKTGEVCIVIIPAETNAVVQEPTILMKVGHDNKSFRELEWVGATAADVYDWAKEKDKPTYKATEITGIGDYIAQYVDETLGISVDTDTQYRITKVDDYNYKLQSKAKGEADTAFADVSTIVIPKYDDSQVTANKDAIALLNNDANTSGSVAHSIATAIAALNLATTYEAKGSAAAVQGDTTATVKSVEDAIAAIKNGASVNTFEAAEEAIADAKKAGTDAMAEAQKKVASVSAGDNSVTIGGTATAPTVAAKISPDADNALETTTNGMKVVIPAAAEYSIVKDSNSGEYAAVYHLTKDGTNVGTAINIPKDMVVSEGSVVTNPVGQPAGTYIKLVLQNVADPLYINVGSLIEYVTSGSQTGDMIVVAVSDDHKVTATITDGTITLAKLDSETQAKINKAHDHENKAVLDGITADKITAWDKVSEKANDADLAAIAKTGNVNDLVQTEGDCIIFNCGSSVM